MIYDIFPFFNEFDTLAIRLAEYHEFKNMTHVVIESPFTFTMKDKPYYFKEAEEKCKFDGRIKNITIPYNDMTQLTPKNHRDIHYVERFQRDYVMDYLRVVCKDDDLVLIGDVDEIPSSASINKFINSASKASRFQTRLFRYFYNLYFQDWRFPHIVRWRELKGWESVYEYRIKAQPALIKGGWHFSSVGNFDSIWEKFNSFGAANERRVKKKLDKDYIKKRIKERLHPFKNGKEPGTIVPLKDMPLYIQENINHYQDMILNG